MISKKNSFALLFILLYSSLSFAQKEDLPFTRLYYQMGIGYNLGAGSGAFENYVENKDGTYSRDVFNGSWGKGVDVSMGFGWKATTNLGLELELGYMGGGNNKEENQYYVTSFSTPFIVKQHASYKSNIFRINPKFVFEIPVLKGNAFYGKIGYMVGFGKARKTAAEEVFYSNGQLGNGSYTWEYTGGYVSGSTMALGFRFKIEEEVSFFMEVTGNNLHRSFEKSSMTEANDNGQNTLALRSVYSRETVYVDIATYDATPNPYKPYEAPSFRSSYSTAGFRIGFIRHF